MARLRFPGRPGHRLEQIRVPYIADDVKNVHDPSLDFLPQFRQKLQLFRDLVGASDEEDEFEGYTKADLKEIEKRFNESQRKISKKEDEDVSETQLAGKRASRSQSEPMENSIKTRNRLKAVVKKSYQDMLKEGFKSPGNAHCVVSMTPLKKSKGFMSSKKQLRYHRPDRQPKTQAEIHGHAPKVKKTEKDMAKFLLEKAKQANLLQQQAKARRLKAASHKTVQRKEFILPTQSSRSSRVIIPNKRFLEDDSVTSPILKKKKSLDTSDSSTTCTPMQTVINKTPVKSDGTLASPVKTSILFEKPLGSLEQPLIVDGKRDRKPSVKILQKIVDNGDDKGVQTFKTLKSPIAAPKLDKILFPSTSGPPVTFQKASDSQKLGMLGAARKQGVSIVQKAKLQLNRAALNKSKAALARSLKAEMKREAKLAGSLRAAMKRETKLALKAEIKREAKLAAKEKKSVEVLPATSSSVSSPQPTHEPEPSTSGIVTEEVKDEELSPQSVSSGPRIKHVCRNAAVVLGKMPATFPEKSEFRLSALPKKEKVELWKQDEEVKAAAKADSDDDRPIEEIIEKSSSGADIIVRRVQADPKDKNIKRLVGPGGIKLYKRKMRCKQCSGCRATDCGECKHCLDKVKFGGRNVWKKCCVRRKCAAPLVMRSATAAFIQPKQSSMITADSETDSNTDSVHSSPVKPVRINRQIERLREDVDPPKVDVSKKASTCVPISSNESQCKTVRAQAGLELGEGPSCTDMEGCEQGHSGSRNTVSGSDGGRKGRGTEVRRLEFESGQDFQLEHIRLKGFGKMRSKIREKVEIQQKYTKNQGNNNQCYPVTLVDPASRQWGSALSQPKHHPIKVDFKGKCDVNSAWSFGIAVTMSSVMTVRTLCFLCSSSGKYELVFCNVCCEPFHKFCLEEFEQPVTGHDADWCCARCQFCSVCGRQNNLLQCDKCQNMYHPECLGPNYPTKPTKEKKIWICTKCVKCKSCGATTPGATSDATWTYDFSLCYECGKLMDKGNFCPICHKCYSDDDWESKMIQCNMCESWVHSKCEGLTDEMYEMLSCLPEDLSFYCQKCSPEGCPEWMKTLREELRLGLQNIMQTLILSKCSQYIIKRETKPVSTMKQIVDADSKVDRCSTSSNVMPGADSLTNTEHSSEKTPPGTGEKSVQENVSSPVKDGLCKSADESVTVCNVTTKPDTDPGPGGTKSVSEPGVDDKSGDKHDSIRLQNGMDECVPGDRSIVSGEGEVRTCTEGTGDKVCDKPSKDKPLVSDVTVGVSVNNELQSCEQVVNESCVTGASVPGDNKPGCLGNVSDLNYKNEKVKTESKPTSSDVGQDKDINKDVSPVKAVTATQQISDVPVDSGIHKSTTVTKEAAASQVVKHHVQFNIAGNKFVEACESNEQRLEPSHPRDLMEVAEKMRTGIYLSVAIFCEDILRIIQQYLDDEREARVTRKKSTQTAKQVFSKQMEKIFPWFRIKQCRYWYSSRHIPDGMLPDATLPPTVDHTYAQWLLRTELPKSPQPSPFKRTQTPVKKFLPLDEEDGEFRTFLEGEDTRRCMLCLQYSDQESNDAGRLLYCGQDDWVHVNCALWSAEVYEDTHGELQNLVEAYSRGKMLKCDLCGLSGATVGCNTRGCKSNYHFMCARDDYCKFQEDKKVFCKYHTLDVDGELLGRNKFSVHRRVYLGCLNVRTVKKQWAKGLNSTDINVLIGSCCVEALGRLTDLSDKPKFLQPADFVSTRIYWSTKDARKRCVYTCRVVEVRPRMSKSPTVELKDTRIVHDNSHPDFVPFSQLDLASYNLGHLQPTMTRSLSVCVDLTAEESVDTSATLSATKESSVTEISGISLLGNMSHLKSSVTRSASFSGVVSKRITSEKDPLSLSWNGSEKYKIQRPVNLKGLSPQTLRLLNIKDPTDHKVLVNKGDGDRKDDISLLKIVNRLNTAAAKSSKSPDITDRSMSPLGRSLLPGIQRYRSKSLDSSPSCIKKVESVGYSRERLVPVPEGHIPWTPPHRLSMRAHSWPKERQTVIPDCTNLDPQQSTTDMDTHTTADKDCELMDIDPISEPLGCSSPKVTGNRTDTHTDRGESMDITDESVNDTIATETQNEKDIIKLQVEGNCDELSETTFVVMTDTSEEISEEEAIRMVQEVLSGSSVTENDGCLETADVNTEDKAVELDSNISSEDKLKEDVIDVAETNTAIAERSASPFIPQFVSTDVLVKQPRVNVKDLPEKTDNLNNKDHAISLLSDESDFGSDIIDITDSVNKEIEGKENKIKATSPRKDMPTVNESYNTETNSEEMNKHENIKVSCDLTTKQNECTDDRSIIEVDPDTDSEPVDEVGLLPESKPTNKDEVDGDLSVSSTVLTSSQTSDQTMKTDCVDNTIQTVDDKPNKPLPDEQINEAEDETTSSEFITGTKSTEVTINVDVEAAKSETQSTEIDPQKKQVLRGLGLGTSDEIEMIKKNSPPKNVSCLNPFTNFNHGKVKRQKFSPKIVKEYPLRRKALSPDDGKVSSDSFSSKEREQTKKKDAEKLDSGTDVEIIEKKVELPVLDPIAKKIKEESLAKSCPEEKGPFKCPTCRRMYRTETSYQTHVTNCTFYVSSSDEDEDSEGSKASQSDHNQTPRSLRSKSRGIREVKETDAGAKNTESEKCKDSVIECESSEPVEITRSSLRKSTIYQRVAIEVEERRLKEESQNTCTIQKKRGRKSLKSKPEDSIEYVEKTPTSVESQSPENRRVTRHSCDVQQSDSNRVGTLDNTQNNDGEHRHGRSTKNSIKGTKPGPLDSQSADEDVTSPTDRRVTRRHKDTSNDSDMEPSKPKQPKLHSSPETKRRTRSTGTAEDVIVGKKIDGNKRNSGAEKICGKRKRGRPKLSKDVLVVKDGAETCYESLNRDEEHKFDSHTEDKEEMMDEESFEIMSDKSVDTSTGSRSGPILDYVSGLIIDPKTGMIYSPTKNDNKSTTADSKCNKSQADRTVNTESEPTDDENENVCNNKNELSEPTFKKTGDVTEIVNNVEKGDPTNDSDVTEIVRNVEKGDPTNDSDVTKIVSNVEKGDPTNDSDVTEIVRNVEKGDPTNDSDVTKIVSNVEKGDPNSDSESSVVTSGMDISEDEGSEMCSVKSDYVKDENANTSDSLLKSELAENEITNSNKEKVLSLDNNPDMSKSELSRAVLQLLKSGRKVVIKNPTSDKSYIWEKTEGGYVGKPLDKTTHGNQNMTPITSVHKSDTNEQEQLTKSGLPLSDKGLQEMPNNQETEKVLTASEILALKKVHHSKEEAEKTEKDSVRKESSKMPTKHSDNERTNLRPLEPKKSPRRILPATAEYVGGIVISPPSGPGNESVQRTLITTADAATQALSHSLQIKNSIVGASVKQVFQKTPQMQSLVQFVNPNSLSNMNALMNYPMVLQNAFSPTLEQLPPMTFSAMSLQHSLGSPLLHQQTKLDQSMNRAPVMTSHQSMSQAPVMTSHQSMSRAPVMTSHQSMNRAPVMTSLLHQSVSGQMDIPTIGNLAGPTCQTNTTIPNSQPNILRKHLFGDHTMAKSPSKLAQLLKPTTVEKMKQLFCERNKISAREAKLKMQHERNFVFVKEKEKFEQRMPGVKIVKISSSKDNVKSPLKKHSVFMKKQKKKRLQKKLKIKARSPAKPRKPTRIAAPHASVKTSHPIIHPQKENCQLPVAAVEEEIQDIPLSTMMELENRRNGLQKGGLDLGHLEYEISSDDGFSCQAESLDGAWKQVIEKVQDARNANRFKQLSYTGLSGLEMFGLSHPNVVYLIEQLSGAGYCRKYKFKYHKHEPTEQEVELINPSGSIRSEPFTGRNPWDMFSFLMSRYRQMPIKTNQDRNEEMAQKSSRRATSMDLPMAMRFRKLKAFSRECVGVYRSHIHGRGLFCKRSIDAGEMIIEYSGEVIRNSMTDTREKYYEGKGIGCYMFRIDDNDVVDATMKGSAARFINHSCEPNCYSKVISVDNRKHIVIFALRRIVRGEELTYDYKFPIEEIKIPCTCGSAKCRKYLN